MRLLDKILAPKALPYDFAEWKTLSFTERSKKVCQAWAIQGFGAPFSTAIFYVLKIAFYIYMWFFFCSYSTSLGSSDTIGTWWLEVEALGKFIFWTTLLEVIGFGGASGPLTARYVPPLGGITYFLRPGTIKVPFFSNIPFLGNDRRTIIDILLYAALLFFLVKVCMAPAITPEVVLPVLILLPLIGILDRTIYLAARADIFLPMILCFMFPLETGHALKMVWFAIWFWAAFSKLTPNFTSVVCVMICNSPFFGLPLFNGFKKSLFKDFPNDLRPSQLATYVSHFGTLVEFSMPIVLLLASSYPSITFYALLVMTGFHFFIFINFPMGVPMEWNVIMVFGGWLLFFGHPEFAVTAISNPIIIGVFALTLFALPIAGNLFPRKVSFLLSMRYYAGTWAYSIWLFKGKTVDKIDEVIPKTSKALHKQLQFLYDPDTSASILSRILAFRFMHLPGRLVHQLLPKAVDNIDDYHWYDGEFIAGEVVGWNFGDGHLHHEPVLNSIQKCCDFQSGDLRVIMVESPQFHTQKLDWRIYDAKDGLLEKGFGHTKDLQQRMPWGTLVEE